MGVSIIKTMVMVAAAFLLLSCRVAQDASVQSATVVDTTFQASFSFNAVRFQSGMPKEGNTLESSVGDSDALGLLEGNLAVLKADPRIRIEVVGHTDNVECIGEDCIQLSLRRAKLVYAWLVDNGVSPAQIDGPAGKGMSRELHDNATDFGRARNRRVEVNFLSAASD